MSRMRRVESGKARTCFSMNTTIFGLFRLVSSSGSKILSGKGENLTQEACKALLEEARPWNWEQRREANEVRKGDDENVPFAIDGQHMNIMVIARITHSQTRHQSTVSQATEHRGACLSSVVATAADMSLHRAQQTHDHERSDTKHCLDRYDCDIDGYMSRLDHEFAMHAHTKIT